MARGACLAPWLPVKYLASGVAAMDLTAKHCKPCEGGTRPMLPEEADFLLKDEGLEGAGWRRDGDQIERDVTCKDFRGAIAFVDRLADLAEEEGHHPDILVHGYKNVRITLTTHAIDGLSENDFIVAAKAERLVDDA